MMVRTFGSVGTAALANEMAAENKPNIVTGAWKRIDQRLSGFQALNVGLTVSYGTFSTEF
jgi:hypothetical protein